MSDRETIARRIRALLAKTVQNGCTEDEAIAAAQLAAKLLASHNMTIDEAQMCETPFTEHKEYVEDILGDRLWKPADGISFLTGCRYWSSASGVVPKSITFFGFDHEVEIAKYLLEICARAMRDGQERVLRANALFNPSRRRQSQIAYLDGMADTLRKRIRNLKPPEPTGTGLIVLRNALIDRALEDAGHRFKERATARSRDYDKTYAIGARAAEGVRLDRGLTGPIYQTERLLS